MPVQGSGHFIPVADPYNFPVPSYPDRAVPGQITTSPARLSHGQLMSQLRDQERPESRPATAPTTLSQLLPPKRDLPFLVRPKTTVLAKESQDEAIHQLGDQSRMKPATLIVNDEEPLLKKRRVATKVATKKKGRFEKKSKVVVLRPISFPVEHGQHQTSQNQEEESTQDLEPEPEIEPVQLESRLPRKDAFNTSLPDAPPSLNTVSIRGSTTQTSSATLDLQSKFYRAVETVKKALPHSSIQLLQELNTVPSLEDADCLDRWIQRLEHLAIPAGTTASTQTTSAEEEESSLLPEPTTINSEREEDERLMKPYEDILREAYGDRGLVERAVGFEKAWDRIKSSL
ncbi:MAG: hypothetical protein Q9220_000428 [cf. Caloplaca sp. 1 TL-2023]